MNLVIFAPKSSGDVPARFIQEAMDKATHDFWVTVIILGGVLIVAFVVMLRAGSKQVG